MNPAYDIKMRLGETAKGRVAPSNKELSDTDWAGIFEMFNTPGPIDFSTFQWPGITDLFPGWTGEGDTTDPVTGDPAPGPGSPGAPGSAGPLPGSGSNPLSWLQQIARMLGLPGGGPGSPNGGGGDITRLLSLLGLGGGAAINYGNTREATEQMLRANEEATTFLRGQMGAGDERFKPYTDIGRDAVWQAMAGGGKPLADRYKPLGSGRGMTTLGNVARGK